MEIDEGALANRAGGIPRACEHCAGTFLARRSDRRFCSDRCRLKQWRRVRAAAEQRLGDDSQHLRVIADLRMLVARCGSGNRCEVDRNELSALAVEVDLLRRQHAEIQRACAVLQQLLMAARQAKMPRGAE
jgi:ribosomal protein S27AE